MPQLRAAIYVRAGIQREERDRVDQAVRARGFQSVVFEERPGTRRRWALERVLVEAREGRLVAVFVSCLSDLGRRFDCSTAVLELTDRNIGVFSIAEPWVADAPPAVLAAFFGWVASERRAHHVARTVLGIAGARRRGVHVGRPRLAPEKLHAATALLAPGVSQRAAARAVGISEAALRAHLKAQRAEAMTDTRPTNEPTVSFGLAAEERC